MTSLATSEQAVYAFGTSGYRNNTEAGFNEAVVSQITHAIADYLIVEAHKANSYKPLLLGGDTRAKTHEFLPVIANILLSRGLDVYQAEGDLPTPVLAYAAATFEKIKPEAGPAAGVILMTASHNPWDYGGYNFLTPDGAVVPSPISKAFEAYQKAPLMTANQRQPLNRGALGLPQQPQHLWFNPYAAYQKHLQEGLGLNLAQIKASGLKLFYDPLYATGRTTLPRLLNDAGIELTTIHGTDQRPADYTGMPEPSEENLLELASLVKHSNEAGNKMVLGLSNDGDADRFGILDEQGRFIHPNTVLALVLYHLSQNRKASGVVARSQSTSHQLDALAGGFALEVVQTPVGYKYIAETFIERDEKGLSPVLLGGEGSGGLSVLGHIPEKDGIVANLLIAELVAVEGKPLSALVQQINAAVPQRYVFNEWAIKTTEKAAILARLQTLFTEGGVLAGHQVAVTQSQQSAQALKAHYGTQDGIKLYFEDGSWLLARASGTEPLVRLYWETVAPTLEAATQASSCLATELRRWLTEDLAIDPALIKAKT